MAWLSLDGIATRSGGRAIRYQDVVANVKCELLVDDVRLVILNPRQKRGPEANLLAFRPNGELLWQLTPPDRSPDSWDGFVNGFSIRDGKVWVSSWSGFSLRIDPQTGNVVEQLFTK